MMSWLFLAAGFELPDNILKYAIGGGLIVVLLVVLIVVHARRRKRERAEEEALERENSEPFAESAESVELNSESAKSAESAELNSECAEQEESVESVESVESELDCADDTPDLIITDDPTAKLVPTDVRLLRRSFENKLCLSEEELKRAYSEIRNEIAKRKNVRCRLTVSGETVRYKKDLLAIIKVVGKNLYFYLALDPANYDEKKFPHRNAGDKKCYRNVPFLFRVKSKLSVKRCLVLINDLMDGREIARDEAFFEVDYASYFPFKSDAMLRSSRIAHLIRSEITEEEASAMDLGDIEEMIDERRVLRARAGRKEVVNIDALSEAFHAGDTVTLDDMIDKRLVNLNAGSVKVLAIGRLKKPLHVIADSFSEAAVKMILLTGGSVTRIRNAERDEQRTVGSDSSL